MTSIFLENERIYMRTLSGEDDFREYEKWLNDQENTVYMGSGKFPVTVDSLKKYVENFAGNQNGMLLGIFLKGKDEHIDASSRQPPDHRNTVNTKRQAHSA